MIITPKIKEHLPAIITFSVMGLALAIIFVYMVKAVINVYTL